MLKLLEETLECKIKTEKYVIIECEKDSNIHRIYEYEKNLIELKAQIQLLRHLISEYNETHKN
jgi:hypothetical protein